MREMSKRIETMQSRFKTDFPQWANVALGAKALQMIRERLRVSGKSPDGGQYKPYGSKFLILRKGMFTNNAAEKQAYKEAEWFTTKEGKSYPTLPGGYRRLRQIHGLQVNHKDFLFSNQMWPSVHVAGTSKTPNGYMTIVEANNSEADNKLKWNEDREKKQILALTKQEEANLDKIFDDYITNIVRRVFNG